MEEGSTNLTGSSIWLEQRGTEAETTVGNADPPRVTLSERRAWKKSTGQNELYSVCCSLGGGDIGDLHKYVLLCIS